jgi:hypothetical protein
MGREAMMVSTYRLKPSDERDGDPQPPPWDRSHAQEHEDLPYRVEIWNEAKSSVESILAITVSASIGYAAYYAATREFPDRYITLRHKDNIINRWNGPAH